MRWIQAKRSVLEGSHMRTRITVTRADSKIYRNRGSDAAVWVIVAFAALYFLTRVINDIDQHEQVDWSFSTVC